LPPAFRHYGHAHCHIIIDISLPHWLILWHYFFSLFD
jgi:hypothetical protein